MSSHYLNKSVKGEIHSAMRSNNSEILPSQGG